MAGATVNPRFVVVGAGPAGTRCAQALVKAGVCPTVIDEGRRNGGQIYRRQPENFTRPYRELYGSEAGKARAVHNAFDALEGKIDYLPEALIWGIDHNQLFVVADSRQQVIEFDVLIICTGATDRLMPLKGWHRAGTFTLGGAQVALKSQACAVGRRIVFMGTGPLLYLVASQYAKAGAGVAAVLDTSPLWRRILALPKLLRQPGVLWKGLLLIASLYLHRIKVHTGVQPIDIQGTDDQGVTGLRYRTRSGSEQQINCDAVAVGYHLRPETQLSDLAGCEFYFEERIRQWLPRLDSDGRSTAEDIYLAGDGARILGAGAAEIAGELAALAALTDRGFKVSMARIRKLRRRLANWQVFARGLAESFPWPAHLAAELDDNTVLCRCEAVTVGELRNTIRACDAGEANRAKAFSRVGMGRCQGRYCGNGGAEVLAACAGITIEQAGRLRGQPPVKPLPIHSVEPLQ